MPDWLRVGRNYVLRPTRAADAPIVHVRLGDDGWWDVVIDREDGCVTLPGRWRHLYQAQDAAIAWARQNGFAPEGGD